MLRKRASEIVELVEKTECELRKDEEIPAGDIYIGCCESEEMRIIAQTARALQRTCPQIRYQLFSGNAQDLSDRLEKGLLDFTVMTEPGDLDQKYDVIRLPHRDRWTVLLRQDSPLSQKAVIRPEDLRDKPLILSRSHQFDREGLASWLRCDYDALHIAATYNLLYNASLLVSEGVGYAICFQNLINICGNSNLCYRPMEPALDLVRKKYQVFSRAAERFLQVLQQQIGLQGGRRRNKKKLTQGGARCVSFFLCGGQRAWAAARTAASSPRTMSSSGREGKALPSVWAGMQGTWTKPARRPGQAFAA